MKQSTDQVGDNTGSLEQRSFEQLEKLTNLTSEMTRTTDQFVDLNSNMVSLRESINALGVAQDEIARIEREKAEAEQAEKDRLALERQATEIIASAKTAQTSVDNFQDLVDYTSQYANGNVEKYRGYDWITMDESAFHDKISDWSTGSFFAAYTARRLEFLENWQDKLEKLRDDYEDLTGEAAPFALGGVFSLGRPAANSVVTQPTHFDMGLMGEAGEEAIMPLSRGADGSLGVRAELPPVVIPPPAAMGQFSGAIERLLQENNRLMQENTALLKRLDAHGAASVRVAQAGHQRQIEATERGNRSLDDLAAGARLESAR